MSWNEISESLCPIARALSVVGERWTLLILREIAMGGTRFDDIQAQTGMSSFLLSTRLKQLEADGVIERHLYCSRPKRYEYRATEKGKELDLLLLALRAWGMKWGGFPADAEPAVKLVNKRTGEEIGAEWTVSEKDLPFTFDRLESIISPAFQAERERRSAQFQRREKSTQA